jgi:Helix-turn-helix domain.
MKRILLKLTTDQKLLINKWFDVTRVVYNHALHAVESQRVPCKLQDLRNAFVKKGCPFLQKHTWAEENVPFDVRDEAVRDLYKAYKSNFAKLRAGHNTHFKIKFQRKRGGYGSMSFLKKHWGAKDRTYFKRTLKQWTGSEAGTRIGSCEPIPNMEHDGRIIKGKRTLLLDCHKHS